MYILSTCKLTFFHQICIIYYCDLYVCIIYFCDVYVCAELKSPATMTPVSTNSCKFMSSSEHPQQLRKYSHCTVHLRFDRLQSPRQGAALLYRDKNCFFKKYISKYHNIPNRFIRYILYTTGKQNGYRTLSSQ